MLPRHQVALPTRSAPAATMKVVFATALVACHFLCAFCQSTCQLDDVNSKIDAIADTLANCVDGDRVSSRVCPCTHASLDSLNKLLAQHPECSDLINPAIGANEANQQKYSCSSSPGGDPSFPTWAIYAAVGGGCGLLLLIILICCCCGCCCGCCGCCANSRRVDYTIVQNTPARFTDHSN